MEQGEMPFCCTFLPPKNYLTMYPEFAPENQHLGLVVPTPSVCQGQSNKQFRAVVWAKKASQLNVDALLRLSRFIPLVLTMQQSIPTLSHSVNISYVGRLDSGEFLELIRDSMVFVASGAHFLGLAPIQAINCGTVFLQMHWSREHGQKFVRGKPTSMVPTSPVPWFEQNYQTYAKTIDFENSSAIVAVLNSIVKSNRPKQEVKEFTAAAFVERVYNLIHPLAD
jgi:hypothetical protein